MHTTCNTRKAPTAVAKLINKRDLPPSVFFNSTWLSEALLRAKVLILVWWLR